jgi:hypothetical protein
VLGGLHSVGSHRVRLASEKSTLTCRVAHLGRTAHATRPEGATKVLTRLTLCTSAVIHLLLDDMGSRHGAHCTRCLDHRRLSELRTTR